MQPIKTTNAMNPAPAKGIESFPTPVIDDVVISEVVNSWKGDYQKLEYGVLWKDVSHAPNQGSFPEHKLVFQQPTSEDGQWVKRIWVNDRVNQDSYNYAIKYSAGSQEHPIYIRTYIVPRETYAPLLDGTPDPLFPGALLVDEEAQRTEGELDSKYITVTRVYETIPGPAVPTRRYNERGDLETVIVQTVPPNTPPTADGLLVTQSQVEQVETGKGVKTTATVQDHALLQIKEKKEGLLGETITTDDIVDPSTSPDTLSETVVASTVEQYTATKARKRTTTASGPTSLSQKSKDGKLLGDITSTESIVAPSTAPDSVNSEILSSEVKQVDSGKAIKRNVVLNSTPTLSGNQNEQGLLGNKSTSESIVNAGTSADPLSMSVISSVVEPIDSVRSRKVTVSSSSPTTLTGGQKKEGLLGETSVNESIVTAGASPDSLSQTVVSSVVEPIDSAKSRKVTITATGPTSLSQKSKDGKLLGDITSTESIVAPNANPDAVSSSILSSEVKQVDSGKAIKTNIVLNSTPTLSGKQSEQGLLGVKSTVESVVSAGTPEDPLSMSVISSVVEPIDSIRSRKVTIESSGPTSLSGGQKKEGLLGETNVEESIVAAGTEPDELSETVVSSVVEPIDSSKSKKTTITSSGPTSLKKTSNDGKLLGDLTITESIVSQSASPDAVSSQILSSEVRQIDNGKAVKTNTVLNSTPALSGYQNGEGLLGERNTTEEVVPSNTPADPLSMSVISSTIEPIDSVRSRKVTVSSLGPSLLNGGENKVGLLGEVDISEQIVPAGTQPDSLSQTIVSSLVTPIDSSKSRKTTSTAKGPTQLSGKRINQRGEVETVTESIVAAKSDPDPDGLNIVSSEVEPIDNSKSKKITVEVPNRISLLGRKSSTGLMGTTLITDQIVPNGTPADPLTWTGNFGVIESSVEPISATKSKKTTVTSNGPGSLKATTLIESQLGLVEAEVEKSIVTQSTVASGGLNVVKDSINPLDGVKSERETVTVDAWPENVGVDSDEQLGFGVKYKETIVEADAFQNAQYWVDLDYIDYKPIDKWKSLKREVDRTKLSEVLLPKWIKTPVEVNVTLPDKLLGVKVYWGHSYGAGQSFDHGFSTSSSNYSLSSSGSSKNSYGINGDIYFNIEQGYSGPIKGEKHIFFLEIGKDGRVQSDEIINTLNNFHLNGSPSNAPVTIGATGATVQVVQTSPANYYKPWPHIRTRTENIVLITGGKSETINKSKTESNSINGFASGNGFGTSFDVDVNARSINIPATLHPQITIEEETFGATGGQYLTPTYGVRPKSLAVTTATVNGIEENMPTFPVGNYLYQADVELYKYGFVKVTAITVELTNEYV